VLVQRGRLLPLAGKATGAVNLQRKRCGSGANPTTFKFTVTAPAL
jgi:hypothetical protein